MTACANFKERGAPLSYVPDLFAKLKVEPQDYIQLNTQSFEKIRSEDFSKLPSIHAGQRLLSPIATLDFKNKSVALQAGLGKMDQQNNQKGFTNLFRGHESQERVLSPVVFSKFVDSPGIKKDQDTNKAFEALTRSSLSRNIHGIYLVIKAKNLLQAKKDFDQAQDKMIYFSGVKDFVETLDRNGNHLMLVVTGASDAEYLAALGTGNPHQKTAEMFRDVTGYAVAQDSVFFFENQYTLLSNENAQAISRLKDLGVKDADNEVFKAAAHREIHFRLNLIEGMRLLKRSAELDPISKDHIIRVINEKAFARQKLKNDLLEEEEAKRKAEEQAKKEAEEQIERAKREVEEQILEEENRKIQAMLARITAFVKVSPEDQKKFADNLREVWRKKRENG